MFPALCLANWLTERGANPTRGHRPPAHAGVNSLQRCIAPPLTQRRCRTLGQHSHERTWEAFHPQQPAPGRPNWRPAGTHGLGTPFGGGALSPGPASAWGSRPQGARHSGGARPGAANAWGGHGARRQSSGPLYRHSRHRQRLESRGVTRHHAQGALARGRKKRLRLKVDRGVGGVAAGYARSAAPACKCGARRRRAVGPPARP